MKIIIQSIIFFWLVVLSTANASAVTIDFESDAPGSVANGFTSADAADVHFSDTLGADLDIANGAPQTVGQGMWVRHDDGSGLNIDFDSPYTSISIDFGNDDSCCSSPGDLALLTVFSGATQVGQVSVVLNRDDIINQTVSFSGTAFNRATFFYVDAGLSPINLIEAVDNIVIDGVVVVAPATPVPTLSVYGIGLTILGLLFLTRRSLRAKAR